MGRAIAVVSGSTQIHKLCDDGTASFSGSVGVTGSLNPDGDGQFEFGTPLTRWKDVHAVCTTVGAIFETGLTTVGISKYPTGTVLSWQAGGLVPSTQSEDKMVMGVVQEGKDQPIVFGAEPLLVTGKVKVGDFIVTSKKPGHGKAAKTRKWLFFKRDLLGKIIAQALEPADGDSSLIKCMILKM
jgi:hypothetical protein